MRTRSYAYHVMRRDALAHGMMLLTDPTPDHGAWTAETEDYNALCDAFTVYTEQERRDYAVMLNRVQRSIVRAARARVALWSDRHDAGVFAALRTISDWPESTPAHRQRTNATVSMYPEETRESGI